MQVRFAQIGTILLVCFAVVFLILIDGNQDNHPDASEPISIGTNIWPGYEPLFLARELGLFNKKDVHLIEFASSTQVMQAFRNHVISAAALTLDEALLLKDYGLDPKLILVFDISQGADVLIAKKEITSFVELKGKRIGVENTSLGAFVLMRALELNQLSLSDITIVSLPVNEHDSAFSRNLIDAIITFEPVRSRLLAQGYHELFTSKEIPNEIVDVLVVNQSVLTHQSKQLDEMLKAWFRALSYLNDFPEKSSLMMAGRQKISPKDVLASFDGLYLPSLNENLQLLTNQDQGLHKSVQRLSTMMLNSSLIKHQFNFDEMMINAPLLRIQNPTFESDIGYGSQP